MAQLTIEQVIKIVIAVLVLTIVIYGASSGYKNYIYPYFSGFNFEENKDLTSSYYVSLVKEENIVATISLTDDEQYVYLNKEKSKFYWNSGKIFLDVPYWMDSKVGEVDKEGKIRLNEEGMKYSEIQVLEGAEKVGSAFYKNK